MTCEEWDDTTSSPWTSFAEASHARTSPLPDGAADSRESAPASGENLLGSFASYDPATSSWKTSQLSLLEEWGAYSETWPRAGTMRNGTAFQRQPLVPPTAETGSSLLPTPSASSYGTNQDGGAGRVGPVRPSLQTMASKGLWPTPTVKGNYNRAGLTAKSGDGLATAVAKAERESFPTPTARDWKSSNLHEKNSRPLNEVVHSQTPGPLSPTWVEWLMGFPLGWTDLGASAMPSCPKSRSSSDG